MGFFCVTHQLFFKFFFQPIYNSGNMFVPCSVFGTSKQKMYKRTSLLVILALYGAK